MPETTIVSFVIRFTQEQSELETPADPNWYGAIRHVQSDQQIRFADLSDAISFMGRYIDGVATIDDSQDLIAGA